MAEVVHAFDPVWDGRSRILILGTMPSPASIANRFYYSHPQNRFWPLMAALFGCEMPDGPEEKRAFLLARGIALWDVLASCEIRGADDQSIRKPVANDVAGLLDACPHLKAVFTTGKKATDLYRVLLHPQTSRQAVYLPSTSPANRGRYPFERLLSEWSQIKKHL